MSDELIRIGLSSLGKIFDEAVMDGRILVERIWQRRGISCAQALKRTVTVYRLQRHYTSRVDAALESLSWVVPER